MKDLTKYFINLSKCSEEQVRMLNQIINIDINRIPEFPLLFCSETEWDQAKKGDKFHVYGKTELTYPEFIKLFEGGEGEKKSRIEIMTDEELQEELRVSQYHIEALEHTVRSIENEMFYRANPNPPKF